MPTTRSRLEPEDATQQRMSDGGSVYACDAQGEPIYLLDPNEDSDLPWGENLTSEEEDAYLSESR
jgi:hypothetical protein